MPVPPDYMAYGPDLPEFDPIRSIEGAIAANLPCQKHCVDCDGDDHHWIEDCDNSGEPLMVCKHCPAWREMTIGDIEAIA